MTYQQYLQTPEWKETREKKLSTISNCQICGSSEYINIHHKHYEIFEDSPFAEYQNRETGSILFNEKMGDLMVLCASCHKLWHVYFGKKYFRHKTASKIRRLIKLGCQSKLAFQFALEKNAYSVILYSLKKMNNTDFKRRLNFR